MKLNKIRSIAIISAVFSIFTADMALAISKWTSPPKPGGVPTDIEGGLMNLTNWILGFISIIAVLFVIWGGAQYLTSVGDEDRMESGKRTVTYALMGVVIAGLAYGIINVVVSEILAK
jgi:hypothetical protein